MRHDSEEIAWHTQTLYYRPESPEPVVRARINPVGAGLQVMIFVPDQPELFARICGFFSRLGYSIVDARIHTCRHGYALDSFALLDPENHLPYRDMIGLIVFSLLFGIGLALTPSAGGARLREAIQGLYDVMMRLIDLVLKAAPAGVAALLFTMTARLGVTVLGQIAAYVGVVLLALGNVLKGL